MREYASYELNQMKEEDLSFMCHLLIINVTKLW